MTPHNDTARLDDDLDARTRRISGRILDGIEETLDELAQPRLLRAAIETAVQARCAARLCRNATCRRAGSCRRKPCTLPSLASA